MPDQLKKIIDPIKVRWGALTRPQKYKLLGSIAAVAAAIALVSFFVFRTEWVRIVHNRDFMEVSRMIVALDQAGVRFRVRNNDSTLYVDRRQTTEARIAIELESAAPNDAHFTWDDAFDTGLGTTETERRQRQINATAGDIELQLIAIQGVTNAMVTLSVPQARPFDQNAPLPAASVVLTTTRDIPFHEGRNLGMLVARSVIGLPLENVSIIDQNARTIFSGEEDAHQQDPVGSEQERRTQYRNHVDFGLRNLLSPHILDEVDVMLNFVFDDTLWTEEMSEAFRVPEGEDQGIAFQEDLSRASMQGVVGAFEPGTAWNVAGTPGYQMPGDRDISADQRHEIISRHVDRVVTTTQIGPGWVDPALSSAAVTGTVLNFVYQDLWMAEDDSRTQMDWERFKNENRLPVLINDDFPFFTTIVETTAMAAGINPENIRVSIQQRLVPVDSVPTPWDIPLIVMLAVLLLLLLMLAYGLLYRQKQAAEDEEGAEPELSVEDLLVSTQLEEAKEEAAEELEAIDYFKENEIKKHIEKFINEKPEAVASLLRNWINIEEW